MELRAALQHGDHTGPPVPHLLPSAMSFLLRLLLLSVSLLPVCLHAAEPSAASGTVDTSTVLGKVVTGYQGWFRCEGDGSNNGWHHYSAGGKFEPGHAGIEMWPDMSELGPDEKFATPFRHADGSTAHVFSSVKEATVRRHFEWMRQHGIDGAFLQRFATTTRDARFRGPMDQVLEHCRSSANATGRGWVLMYDLTGLKAGQTTLVIDDWKRLVDEKGVSRGGTDKAYFQHRGKPLVALWGLGFRESPLTMEEWSALLTFFQQDPKYGGCAVMVGVPYHWRTLNRDSIPDPALHALLSRVDILSPWAVGRLATPQDAANRVEKHLKPDLAWCAERKVDYLPVIFPGFSWVNLSKGRKQEAKFDAIPRLGGQFLWSQAVAAKRAGAGMLYVAMFDEMDEATAIFKTSNTPPNSEATQFLADPALPTDHYLWLTGQAGKMIRGEVEAKEEMPGRE